MLTDNLNESPYKVFLIGDTGKPKLDGTDEVLNLLQLKLKEAGKHSAVVFLGDNVYPKGLPAENDKLRKLAESRLKVQLDLLKEYPGQVFFISGNHDWNKGKPGGFDYVKRQEKYIEEYLGRGNVYLPDGGCPGPVEVSLTEYFKIIFINTQWWVQKGRRPHGEKDGCGVKNETHFFQKLSDLLKKDRKTTMIAAHHPLYSKAMHGGAFSPKQHLFPLRFWYKHLYLPLPLAGSLYPLYRKYFGVVEDISYPPYRKMKKKLLEVFFHHKNLIYASGHDHNLQYIKKAGNHYLISGSGSKAAYARKGRSSVFSYSIKGFLELRISKDGSTNVVAWGADKIETSGLKLHEGKAF